MDKCFSEIPDLSFGSRKMKSNFGQVESSLGNQKVEKRSKMLKNCQFGAKILAFFENRFAGVMTKNH